MAVLDQDGRVRARRLWEADGSDLVASSFGSMDVAAQRVATTAQATTQVKPQAAPR